MAVLKEFGNKQIDRYISPYFGGRKKSQFHAKVNHYLIVTRLWKMVLTRIAKMLKRNVKKNIFLGARLL